MYTLRKRGVQLRQELAAEEQQVMMEKYRKKMEVARIGHKYTPWATFVWKQGKKLQVKDGEIRVLKNLETGELETGQGIRKVMEQYMKRMWGTVIRK